ncbi:MAG: serine hydrolase [Ignavibacteria bacterium]|nr:serine hydrolase [Ignavibacteria bacterium]
MSGYLDNKKQKFAAVWVPNSRNWHVTGVASPNLSPFDDDIELFMKEFTIPNASLAVSRNGKLLMARGYSWITSSETQTEPVSLFRIGSISKVITATAIAILAEKEDVIVKRQTCRPHRHAR